MRRTPMRRRSGSPNKWPAQSSRTAQLWLASATNTYTDRLPCCCRSLCTFSLTPCHLTLEHVRIGVCGRLTTTGLGNRGVTITSHQLAEPPCPTDRATPHEKTEWIILSVPRPPKEMIGGNGKTVNRAGGANVAARKTFRNTEPFRAAHILIHYLRSI